VRAANVGQVATSSEVPISINVILSHTPDGTSNTPKVSTIHSLKMFVKFSDIKDDDSTRTLG
jgi:hypothetical protein